MSKVSHPVIIQEWEESERGWGVRPDGFTIHKTMTDRDAFVREYNEKNNNLSEAPDEYTRTSGPPYVKDVNQETYDAIAKSTLGMWGKGNRPDASIFPPPAGQAHQHNKKEYSMTDKASTPSATETKNPGAAGVEINGGVLTRAPKTQSCTCKVPDIAANAIEDGDEWQCSCSQKWRAKINPAFGAEDPASGGTGETAKAPYWRRIAKRTPKGGPGTPAQPG